MKIIALIITLLSLNSLANAQEKQKVSFHINNGKEVQSKDSADFIRVLRIIRSDRNAILQEDYANGKPKTRGEVSTLEPKLVYEGAFTRYENNGMKESLTHYKNGKPVGKGYYFLKNGETSMIVDYNDVRDDVYCPIYLASTGWTSYKLIYYADSTGAVMVKDGNGYFKEQLKQGEDGMRSEGSILEGLMDGFWSASKPMGTYSYTELYKKGKFISGEAIKDGKSYSYKAMEELHGYVGGIQQFYRYIANSINNVYDGSGDRVYGKVVVNFVIDTAGSVVDVNILQSENPLLNQEALRVMENSPKWIPGKQRGIPIRTMLNMPFTFR